LGQLAELDFGALVYLQKSATSWSEAIQSSQLGSDEADDGDSISPAELTRRRGRAFGLGAQILRDLNISKLELISDTAVVSKGMTLYGLEIMKVTPVGAA